MLTRLSNIPLEFHRLSRMESHSRCFFVFVICTVLSFSSISTIKTFSCLRPIGNSNFYSINYTEGIGHVLQLFNALNSTFACVNFTATQSDNVWNIAMDCAEESRDSLELLTAESTRYSSFGSLGDNILWIEACNAEGRYSFMKMNGLTECEPPVSSNCTFSMTIAVGFDLRFRMSDFDADPELQNQAEGGKLGLHAIVRKDGRQSKRRSRSGSREPANKFGICIVIVTTLVIRWQLY